MIAVTRTRALPRAQPSGRRGQLRGTARRAVPPLLPLFPFPIRLGQLRGPTSRVVQRHRVMRAAVLHGKPCGRHDKPGGASDRMARPKRVRRTKHGTGGRRSVFLFCFRGGNDLTTSEPACPATAFRESQNAYSPGHAREMVVHSGRFHSHCSGGVVRLRTLACGRWAARPFWALVFDRSITISCWGSRTQPTVG